MSKLYRVISKDYVPKILSEQIISIDYVDKDSIQSIDEFTEFTKPTIRYKADDFLFSLSKENEELLITNNSIELSNTIQFGWYYGKIHKSEIQLYSATNPKKFSHLAESNPGLLIDSFDKYRDFYRPIKATNVLNGAFGLAYTVFKDEYDTFFRKINIHKDKWIIDNSSINPEDYAIFMQIFLFHNYKTKSLKDSLLKDYSKKAYRIFIFFLEECLLYFMKNDYSMSNFLEYLAKKFNKFEEVKPIADEFIKLNDLYVKKGLPVDTKFPPTTRTKEFLDLAKTESENLKELLETNKLDKTAVFLLGMLNLGDRIDEQFSFDNFIPAIVDLTMRHIVDIQVTEKEVVISFDQKEIEKNRNNKFKYVQNYFKELNTLKEFSDELNELTKKSSLFKKIYESQTEIIELDTDSKELEKDIERYGLQKKNLIDQVSESKWFDKKYEEWINSENEKESLKKLTKSLPDEISGLKDDKKDYEKEESDLTKNIDSLKAKIKTLKQTEKSLKLEKEQLENKGVPQKKSVENKTIAESTKESKTKTKKTRTTKEKSKKADDGQTSLLKEDKSPTRNQPDVKSAEQK